MKRFFKKNPKPYYLRSQKHKYQYSYASTPKSKTDACVSCDLPFDESEIAPELRKGHSSVDTPDSRRGKEEESPPLNCTNFKFSDISIDESASIISSKPLQNSEQEITEPTVEENCNQESIYNTTLGKGKEKERSKKDLEGTVFATGGLRATVIYSPADIYKHFPRKVTFQDELWERLIAKQKLQAQKKLAVEETLATLMLRKQVPAIVVTLLKNVKSRNT